MYFFLHERVSSPHTQILTQALLNSGPPPTITTKAKATKATPQSSPKSWCCYTQVKVIVCNYLKKLNVYETKLYIYNIFSAFFLNLI